MCTLFNPNIAAQGGQYLCLFNLGRNLPAFTAHDDTRNRAYGSVPSLRLFVTSSRSLICTTVAWARPSTQMCVPQIRVVAI